MIRPYLKNQLIQIGNDILLLESLITPIPRIIYNSIIKYHNIDELFEIFEHRKLTRSKIGEQVQKYDMSSSLRNVINFYTNKFDIIQKNLHSYCLFISAF